MKIKTPAYKFLIGFMIFAFFFVPAFNAAGQPSVAPQKITLDIKGMDIIDVLKIISQRTGMNIVASKGLSGKVTIFLKDVDAWDALEIILLANDLAYVVDGDIVTIMTGREYETLYGERFKDKKEVRIIKLNYANAAEVAKALTQVKTAIGRVVVDAGSNTLILMETKDRLAQMEEMVKVMDLPTVTKIFSLDYAKSDKLNPKIQDMITKGVGTMRFDERTNKLVVTDLPEKVKEIEKVITAFDEKTRQVLIDAKIVQVELNDKFQAGIDWKAVFKDFTVQQTLSAGLTTGGKITLATLVFGKDRNTLDALMNFLGTTGKTNIISSPRVTALDGQEAKIMVGTKEAYITATTITPATGAVTTAESVNFVDVGIQLYVTPTINKEGYVVMKIRPVVSSVGSRIKTAASPDGVPIVKTSEAETSILVKDGMTIVMGGLMEDKVSKNMTKIPVLGDIPVLGFIFRNTNNEVKKTELVIFLTPTIISGDFIEPIPG
ncbi:MAG: secretin N-terminal domain-containing protein, partial [Candidatus Omnitrophota bacterium]|nr:secretin N-terminal domain-containing protein [Candidatus Omnitrophota bacterium]